MCSFVYLLQLICPLFITPSLFRPIRTMASSFGFAGFRLLFLVSLCLLSSSVLPSYLSYSTFGSHTVVDEVTAKEPEYGLAVL